MLHFRGKPLNAAIYKTPGVCGYSLIHPNVNVSTCKPVVGLYQYFFPLILKYEWNDKITRYWEKCMKKKLASPTKQGKWPKENWNSLGKRNILYECTYAHAHTYPYTQTHPLRFSEICDNRMHLKSTYDTTLSKIFGT